jgi:ABC transporter, ATP-binding protein
MYIVKIDGLKKYYDIKNGVVKAVDGITLNIEKGKFVAIIGASGSGKTTLLNCIAGLDIPTEGSVSLDNLNLCELNDNDLSKLRRRKFGFVYQKFNLIPVINVYDNVILPIKLDKKEVDDVYVKEIIKKIGIENLVDKYPSELSGGQQQRVAIARALSNNPDIIFADEPTGNLDSKNAKAVVSLLKSLVSILNKTLIMVTHNSEIAKEADRVIELNDGKVVKDENNQGVSEI